MNGIQQQENVGRIGGVYRFEDERKSVFGDFREEAEPETGSGSKGRMD